MMEIKKPQIKSQTFTFSFLVQFYKNCYRTSKQNFDMLNFKKNMCFGCCQSVNAVEIN